MAQRFQLAEYWTSIHVWSFESYRCSHRHNWRRIVFAFAAFRYHHNACRGCRWSLKCILKMRLQTVHVTRGSLVVVGLGIGCLLSEYSRNRMLFYNRELTPTEHFQWFVVDNYFASSRLSFRLWAVIRPHSSSVRIAAAGLSHPGSAC